MTGQDPLPPVTHADIDARIASALAAERQALIPTLPAAVDELLDRERAHSERRLTESMRSLELQVAKLENACEPRTTLAVQGEKVLGLPNPLKRVN